MAQSVVRTCHCNVGYIRLKSQVCFVLVLAKRELKRPGAATEKKEERWSRNHRDLEQKPREKRNDGAGTTESWSKNREKRGKMEQEPKSAGASTESKEER